MRSGPHRLLLLLALLVFLVAFVQLGIISVAFDKLGLSPDSASLLLLLTLLGSMINLPLLSVKTGDAPPGGMPPLWRLGLPSQLLAGRTMIAVNVGGCVIPVSFSVFLFSHYPLSFYHVILSIAVVGTVSHALSRPIQGIGIGMPMFAAPLAAALTALMLDPEHSAPLAYIGGTIGVLAGADLLRLKDIKKMGAPFASIGGAGTFDGIFITGIVAVLLA